jgi:hypothetical protein
MLMPRHASVLNAALLASLALAALPVQGLAQDDACDDYVARHYRKDLVLEAMQVTEVARAGDFGPFQDVLLTVRNAGDVELDATVPCDDPRGCFVTTKAIAAKIGSATAHSWMPASIPQGGTAQIFFRLNAGTLRKCSQTVTLDVQRSAGQWGCNVFSNDVSKIQAAFTNSLCTPDLVVGPRPPIPFPFP